MKNLILSTASLLFFTLLSCSKPSIEKGTPQMSDISDNENTQNANTGVMTASEWNDLNNWKFWTELLAKDDNAKMQSKWGVFSNNRFTVVVKNSNSEPLCDMPIELRKDGGSVFITKTDNKGKAELWANLFENSQNVNPSSLQISVNNGEKIISNILSANQGINSITLESDWKNENTANVSFVIDATSSMGDELKYLKNELSDVIQRIKSNNPKSKVITSSVFYKDQGDNYVTKKSNFTEDIAITTSFIEKEEVDGGGDFPEAVHTALEVAINDLEWSVKAKTRIIFLILDAPPHNNSAVISSLQKSVSNANLKGIKLIPILASGADKDCEFSMRLMAMATNGTFAFITDDSKKGNKHYEPSVGSYQVEFLNNLMVRLVNLNLE